MTTADYALVVSLFSAAISLFSLGWGVWSKWVHPKPKIKVGFAVMNLVDRSGVSEPFLAISATNFGPTDTSLKSAVARTKKPGSWWKAGSYRRWQYGMMLTVQSPDEALRGIVAYSWMPKKLGVGDEFSAYIGFKHEHLRDDGIIDVGFCDVFGRHHWAPRKSVRTVVTSIRERWPKEGA